MHNQCVSTYDTPIFLYKKMITLKLVILFLTVLQHQQTFFQLKDQLLFKSILLMKFKKYIVFKG